jgi:hypothetical protein
MAVAAVKTEPENEPLGLDSLTAGETALAERQAAQSITTLGNEAFPQAGIIGALGWVLYRRSDPRMTYQKYMESRTLNAITRELGLVDDEADETGDEEAEGKDDDSSTSSS